jgi:hypothetical protein
LLPLTAGKPLYTILSNLPAGPSGPRTEFIEDGDYVFFNYIPEVGTLDASLLNQPKLTVGASTPSTITLDAATALPVNITVPNPSALTHATEIGIGYKNNPSVGVNSTIRGQAYTKQLGPPNVFTANFITKVHRTAYVPVSPGAGPTNAPTIYNVAWFPEQVFPTGFTKNVTAGQLAQRSVTFGRNITGAIGTMSIQPQPQGTLFNTDLLADITIFNLPHTRTQFFNSENNVRWTGLLFERIFPPGGGETFVQSQESAPTLYPAGSTGSEAWNKPVYGPAVGTLFRPEDWVVRKGNTIIFLPPMLGDSFGHSGHAWNFNPALPGLSGQAVLKQGGVVLATAALPSDPLLPRPSVTVPAGWLPYTLEATLSRGGPTELATTVSAVWSFNSDSVDPNSILRLPLWSVTFKPNLNATNNAPAGSFAIPLTAVSQPGSPVAGINTITVQYSTNDGATWQNATVTGSGVNRTATVTNPGTTGFVSLRATATDFAGNSVTQTTIRAYRVGP